MKTLNIYNIEKLIFLNPKAKQVLWKEFSVFFKEYIFLKQCGVDSSLFSKLYIKFFEQFSKNDFELYLKKIFNEEKVNFNINFKNSIINIHIKLNDSTNKFNFIDFKPLNINPREISHIYKNIICSRNKDNLNITMWK